MAAPFSVRPGSDAVGIVLIKNVRTHWRLVQGRFAVSYVTRPIIISNFSKFGSVGITGGQPFS